MATDTPTLEQAFRKYREYFEEQKKILEQRYAGQLEQAIADAVYLAARNGELEQVCCLYLLVFFLVFFSSCFLDALLFCIRSFSVSFSFLTARCRTLRNSMCCVAAWLPLKTIRQLGRRFLCFHLHPVVDFETDTAWA